MAGRSRHAAPPTAELLEAGRKAREEERRASQATPGYRPPPEEHNCAGQHYKVLSNRVVNEAKGETVSLCPHKGATKALVESGHLTPVESATARAVTTSPVKVTGDKKGADHG